MCFEERKTERRNRSLATRCSFARTRWRRRKKSALAFPDIALLLFAFLPTDRFRRVFDPLALVRFGRSICANLGCDLADALAIGAAHGDHSRSFAGDLDIARDP